MAMAFSSTPTPPVAPSQGRRWLHALSVALRGLYLWLVQAAVGLVWLLLVVYLAINSPSASSLLTQVLTDALPGALQIQSLQWGPSPGSIVLRGVAIDAPDGTRVIAIDEARIRLQIVRLLTGLQVGKLDLRLDEVQLWRPVVRMDEDAQGRLRLPLAFSDPDAPPSPEPGMPVKLSVGGIVVRDATYDMQLPAITIHGEGLQFDGDVRVETRGDDPPAIDYHATAVSASYAEARVAAVAQLPPLPSGTLHAAAIDGSLEGVKVRDLRMWLGPKEGIDLELPHSVLGHADLTVELGDEVRVRADHIALAASNRLPFLRQLLGPLFDADAHIDGGFSVDPQQGFRAQGKVRGRGLMAGFQGDRVAADVLVEAGPPGEAAVRVTARDLEVDAFGAG